MGATVGKSFPGYGYHRGTIIEVGATDVVVHWETNEHTTLSLKDRHREHLVEEAEGERPEAAPGALPRRARDGREPRSGATGAAGHARRAAIDAAAPETAEAPEKGLLRRLRRELRAGADTSATTEKEACRAVGELSHLLRDAVGGRDGLRVLPRDVRVVRGLLREVRSAAIDEPPQRRVGRVPALSRAVEGRPARGDAHLAAPVTPPTDE